MWGMPSYQPEAMASANDVFSGHGARFQALIGRSLAGVWAMVFVSDGTWCSAGPLVLDFDGTHLDVLAEGFDTLYVSWNAIDVDAELEQDEDPELALSWTRLDVPELRPVIGASLQDVRILENHFRLVPDDGEPIEAWLLGGLEFLLGPDDHAIQLVNGLETLSWDSEPSDSERWRRRIGFPRP